MVVDQKFIELCEDCAFDRTSGAAYRNEAMRYGVVFEGHVLMVSSPMLVFEHVLSKRKGGCF